MTIHSQARYFKAIQMLALTGNIRPSNVVHVIPNAVAPDMGIPTSGSDQTSEHGDGGGFARSIMTEQRCNVIFKEFPK